MLCYVRVENFGNRNGEESEATVYRRFSFILDTLFKNTEVQILE